MDLKEAVRAALKELILPELEDIRKESHELHSQMELTNKRLDDINRHLADQSRRIDETNKRIDDTNKRIDDVRAELTSRIDDVRAEFTARFDGLNTRVDQLTFQVGKLAQELERMRQSREVTADLLHRVQRLEKRVIGE